MPTKLALKLKAKEREKEIQQDMQNNMLRVETERYGEGGGQSKQNISSRKIVVIWELDPLTPKVYTLLLNYKMVKPCTLLL